MVFAFPSCLRAFVVKKVFERIRPQKTQAPDLSGAHAFLSPTAKLTPGRFKGTFLFIPWTVKGDIPIYVAAREQDG